jgi:tetratricopeptide (TPR) repeat protein
VRVGTKRETTYLSPLVAVPFILDQRWIMPTATSKHAVFISYARAASRSPAVGLYEALGGEHGGVCFLDSTDIEAGEPFPSTLVDSLLDAQVVVVFVEPIYFTRDFCRLELEIASTPFLRLVTSGAPQGEREAALRGIVLALPSSGTDPMLDRVPPALRDLSWPSAENPHELAAVVRRRLDDSPPTFRKRYEEIGELEMVRAMLLEGTRLLPPLAIGSIPFVAPPTMRESLRSRFIGRADDLWRVHEALTTRRGDLKAAAGIVGSVEAAGGFGKTQLAAEYVYRHATRTFRGGIFWIDAEREPESQLYEVLRALDPKAPPIQMLRPLDPKAPPIQMLRPPEADGVAAALARVIRGRPISAEPILFIIDNVPEPEPGERPTPLQSWCPVLGEVSALTTSRHSVHLNGGLAIRLEIRELQPEHAVMLLRWDLPPEALFYSEWRAIVDWVGCLPLGVELLNALLRFGGVTPRSLLETSQQAAVTQELDNAMEVLRPSVPHDALRGVTEVLSISYERLSSEERSAARSIAWMSPAAIPEMVIEAFGPEMFTPSVRATLRGRHLVNAVLSPPEADVAYFGIMHRVIADFLRSRSQYPLGEIAWVSRVLNGLLESSLHAGPKGGVIMRAVTPAVLAFTPQRLARREHKDKGDESLHFANKAGEHMWLAGRPAEAAEMFEMVRAASAQLLGPSHAATFAAMNNLAAAWHDLGMLSDASALLRDVLEASRVMLGDEDPQTLSAMNNLAATLVAVGSNLAEAETLYESVVKAREHDLGHNHPDTLVALNNLAATRRERGDLVGAHALAEQNLDTCLRVLGAEHSATLIVMVNAANCRFDVGDITGARELQEQLLQIKQRIYGTEHPHTLLAMNNLANTRSRQGDVAGARTLHEQVLRARRQAFGDRHPDTLLSMGNLAITLSRLGDDVQSQALFEQVIEMQKSVLGHNHPDTLASMSNLALIRRKQVDAVGAQTIQEHVLEVTRRVLGVDHPTTLTVMSNLALTLASRNEFAHAQALQEHVVEAKTRIYGPIHSETMTSIRHLAATLGLQGEFRRARALIREAQQGRAYVRVTGTERPVRNAISFRSIMKSLRRAISCRWNTGHG